MSCASTIPHRNRIDFSGTNNDDNMSNKIVDLEIKKFLFYLKINFQVYRSLRPQSDGC